MSSVVDSAENACVVCFKTVDIYSIGECDHPVCHECSTRMRVLCLQTECPICRHDLAEVIFTPVCELFKILKCRPLKASLFERKYKICFTDENVRGSYNKLLDHDCKKCDQSVASFRNFGLLKEHMRKEHEFHFCDLCVENLKIFTCERKVYTRQQLALHKRKGDPDDTSHKGHPLCEFCEERYVDTDELYRHLRKDHLYCHLCDSDGLHHYYGSYKALNEHSRRDHFLCEEGECGEQKLSVFRSDIDLKAHRASVHGQGLSKQASRQARTLEVQFMLTRRPMRGPPPHARAERVENVPDYEDMAQEEVYYGEDKTKRGIDTDSTEQFPNLGESSGGPIVSMNHPTGMVIRQTKGALARTEENFPSLSSNEGQAGSSGASSSSAPTFRVNITHQPGPSSAIIRSSAKPNVSIQVHNHSSTPNRISVTETSNKQLAMRLADNAKKSSEIRKFQDEFPSLSKRDMALLADDYVSTNTMRQLKKPVPVQPPPQRAPPPPVVQSRPPPLRTSEAFPELPSAAPPAVSKPAERPQWITVNKTKEKPKPPGKVAPAPQIASQNDLDSPADFPRLAPTNNVNSKQKKKPEKNDRQASVEDFSVRETNNNGSKKDKKKNNESGERPPDCAPPDLTSKHKRSDKENSQRGVQNNNKKNSNERPPDDIKEKKKNAPKSDEKLSNRSGESEQKSRADKIMIVNTSESEYPSLNATGGPPGFGKVKKGSAPPPGFAAKARPPPGFRGSAVPPCDAFTFTNSSGESFRIPAHDYVQPPDFHRRNKSLVADFIKALDCRDGIHEFKQLSQMFREGTYSAESYFEHCKKSMGDRFRVIFPELLSLLPDIGKQQELFKLYGDDSELIVCNICGQVLTPGDVPSHSVSHDLLANFPALGSPTPQTATSWRK